MTVRIEIIGDRIAASIPWMGGRGRDLAKGIAGHRPVFDKTVEPNKFKYWTYPLAMSTCRAFRETFGRDLTIGPKLAEWAWDQRRNEEALEALRAGDGADLPRVRAEAPALWAALQERPFQIAGAAFIRQGMKVCLGDDPRLGKTYQALASIVESGVQTILIACPKTATRSVWMRKINELAPKIMPFVAQEDRAERDRVIETFQMTPYVGPKALIINSEMIRIRRSYQCQGTDVIPRGGVLCPLHGKPESMAKPGSKKGCQGAHEHKFAYHPQFPELFKMEWDAIILDECHHALASQYNYQSDNITQIRLGAVKLRLRDGGLKLGMSGTPFRSKLMKSWGVLNWLRPDVFSSFWQFAEDQFGTEEGEWGRKVVKSELKSEERFQDTLRPYYLARTKAEVAPQLPPIVYAGSPPASNPDGTPGVYLEMTPKQAKAYADMKEMASAQIEGGKLNANGVLAELTRLRQFASSAGRISQGKFVPAAPSNKLEWVLQYVEEMEEIPGAKVVIATQFTALANLFATELRGSRAGREVLVLTGETTSKQRDHVQDRFMNGSPRIIVINMFAGGEAIDLSAADDLILLDEPWTDDTLQQVENRVQNLAKQQQITIHRLRSEGTVEDSIAELTDEQRHQLMSAKPAAIKAARELINAVE